MQFVEVELDPGECAIAEAGSMMYMTHGIGMETIFGDGTQTERPLGRARRRRQAPDHRREPLHDRLPAPGERRQGARRLRGALRGKIIPIDLRGIGGELICQKDSFLCAARGVSIGIAFQKKLGVGLFGGEGFIMERLQATACASSTPAAPCTGRARAGREAARRHRLHRRAACPASLRHRVRRQDQDGALRRRRAVLRDADRTREGLAAVLAVLAARGRIVSASTGWRKEEGSVLDRAFGLGRMIDGD
jgi:hypothetical protein